MADTAPAERLLVPIEVFSDTLCPWCWVEKRTIEVAVRRYEAKHPDVDFELVWRSFCLNPLLKTRCDKLSLYDEWSGGSDNFQQHMTRVRTAAAPFPDLRFSVTGSTGPSRLSQVLIRTVLRRRGPAAQARVVEALFRGHFAEGRDVSDEAWLVSVGRDAGGLPADVVRADLRDDDCGRAVDDEAEAAVEERGVEAVPCVIVLGRYKVGGFQREDVFKHLFDRIRAENAPPPGGGETAERQQA
ncbi:DSBA-like thioredoxin domain-containing protein [Purpureocillium lavendulum]|uniref:DSBA-like thioredoxin domain-containing protein n=1 Tax=Purpureocillium lavendulum TaxID=1247861 RepID=A0AB34FTD9_9HYPO|nr:DSBA-like thioredoxin domain-containing protein [Purpureocillium lavendulum]